MHVEARIPQKSRNEQRITDKDNEKGQRDIKQEEDGQNRKHRGYPKTGQKQDHRQRRRQFGNIHREIIDCIDFENATNLYRARFEEAKLEIDDDDFTLLHRINKLDEDKLSDEVLQYIEEMVLQKPQLLTQEAFKTVPLIEAARSRTSILFRVFDLLLSKASGATLETHDQSCNRGTSCPVRNAIPHGLQRHFTMRTNTLEGDTSGTITPPPEPNAVDENNVCLTAGMNINAIVEKDRELRNVLQAVLGPVEQAREFFKNLISDRNFASSCNRIQLGSFSTILDLCPDEVFVRSTLGQLTPIQMAINIIDKGSLDLPKLCDTIKLMVNRSPASVFSKFTINNKPKTLFQLLSEKSSVHSSTHGNLADLERYLKPKRIYLSLSGETNILNSKYVSRLRFRSGIKFETVLGYVKLPYWNPKPANRPATTTPDNESPEDELFEWLRMEGVEEILTVDVDDDGEQPHTNRAIRKCFKGISPDHTNFHVVTWKWKKFDLCSETIFEAAPAAREVYLYSRGNTAVLRSWASETGIAKLSKLEKLVVEICPQNDADAEDCENYKEEFEAQIRRRCKNLSYFDAPIVPLNQVQVSESKQAGTSSTRPEPTSAENRPMPKSMEWISELKGYKDFMSRLYQKANVKVAILDTGSRLDVFEAANQDGKSFHPEQDWFIGPCEHGTAMARFVRDICPFADLLICRLDDSRRVDSKQPFTISSCTKALQYALDRGAEIISMSWTYEIEEGETDSEKDAFATLVQKVVQENKAILFCSHPDRGPNIPLSKFGPVSLPGVIKICSATEWGDVSAQNTLSNADFMLPGENLLAENVYVGEAKGSSFATAIAAGLAALVLLSLKCNKECRKHDRDADNAKKALDIVARHHGMRKVFKILAKKAPGDLSASNCFVRPNLILKGDDEDDHDYQKEHLGKIVNQLVPQEVLEAGFNP
ncbi:hypothetical protein BDV59DRAFT_206192 [Aspergillus ambiguus]|uniref:uncharacterized protein n=1 Tax=Aspergillus ambiguus TaxID=176160 RepID=UPI003CCCA1AD